MNAFMPSRPTGRPTPASRRAFLGGLVGGLPFIIAACGGTEAPAASPTSAPAPSTPAPSVRPPTAAPSAATPVPSAAILEKELVIYSSRKESLMEPTVEAFQKKTGVKVSVKSGGSAELRLLIGQEGGASKADIYYTTDYVDAELLRQKGLLAPFQSSLTDGVPAEFKAPDGAWTGVIGRSRNIMVNTTLVKPADYPASVFDLADPKWKGRIAITRLTDGTPVWLASLILLKGEEATTAFLTTLFKINGMKVLNGGSNVADAVAQGEFAAGFVNHYYYVPKKRAGAPVDLIYPDEATGGIGTLVIPLTVAALKSAPHPNVARAFIDFVLSPEGAAPMMTQEGEFPLRPGIPLGDHGADGVRTIDKIRRPAAFDINKLLLARDRAIELYTPLFT